MFVGRFERTICGDDGSGLVDAERGGKKMEMFRILDAEFRFFGPKSM